MSDEQRKPGWLARRREKQRLRRERSGDSAEKTVQRHTRRGRELEAKDRAEGMTAAGPGGGP